MKNVILFISLFIAICYSQVDLSKVDKTKQTTYVNFNAYVAAKGAQVISPFFSTNSLYVTGKLTVPSTIDLAGFLNGAKFAGNTGSATDTIVIYKMSANPLYQIFDTSIIVQFVSGAVPAVRPEWWGAKGDGITDDSRALQLAANALDSEMVLQITGKYNMIPDADGAISIKNKKGFTIQGYSGCKLFNRTPVLVNGSDQGSKRILYITDCSDFKIDGINFEYYIDWNSSVDSGTQRFDQVINIYNSAGNDSLPVNNFTVSNNSFYYNGPQMSNPILDKVSRLSIVIVNSATQTAPIRRIRNFKILNNHFQSCIGRTLYILLCENGTVEGNTWDELGSYVNADSSVKQSAESKGIRVLGCHNVTIVGNALSGYTGSWLNHSSLGSTDFITVNRGTTGEEDSTNGDSRNITISSNVIKGNRSEMKGVSVGDSKETIIIGNTIQGDTLLTEKTSRAINIETDTATNTIFTNNIIKDVNFPVYIDVPAKNFLIENNNFILGSNHLQLYSDSARKYCSIGNNYYSDKGSMACYGPDRYRRFIADSLPPTDTGVYKKGDICYNKNFAYQTNPVYAWAFLYDATTKAQWGALYHHTLLNNTTPTSNLDSNGRGGVGVMMLYSGKNVNGDFIMYNGKRWVYADGNPYTDGTKISGFNSDSLWSSCTVNKFRGTQQTTSSTTGAIQCDGGISVDSSIWCGKYLMQQGIYGAVNIYDNSTAQSIPTGATYTKLTCFPSIGLNSYVTCDTANDKITFTKTGKYRVTASLSFSCGTNNVEWRVAAFLNNVEQNQCHFIRKIGTAGDVGNAGVTGFINVSSAPWDLDLRARHNDGGSVNLTVVYGNLNVEYVGE